MPPDIGLLASLEALIALASPILGAAADFLGAKRRFMGFFVTMGVSFTAALWFVREGDWMLGSAVFMSLDSLGERLRSGEARRAGKYGTSAVVGAPLKLVLVLQQPELTQDARTEDAHADQENEPPAEFREAKASEDQSGGDAYLHNRGAFPVPFPALPSVGWFHTGCT